MPESVVLLHGFSGTHRAWDGVVARLDPERYLPLALDLPGHGAAADAERPITFAGCVAHVLAAGPERFVLCGYSQGGRIALHVALAAPERVSRLVLVSTSAGIEDAAERAGRRRSDHRLADELESGPFERFHRALAHPAAVRRRTPRGGPPRTRGSAPQPSRRARRGAPRHRHRGDGAALGPTRGAADAGHRARGRLATRSSRRWGRRMVELLPDAQLVVAAGGHGLPLENPAAVAVALDGR